MEGRVILFDQDIDQYTIENLLARPRTPSAPRIVHISSTGGEFEFFNTLGPAIRRHGLTMMAGEVASAANILYLLGQNRWAFPDAMFHFHQVHAVVEIDSQEERISLADLETTEAYSEYLMGEEDEDAYRHWLKLMREAQAWYIRFISENTEVEPRVILNLMKENVTLGARDAMRYGIVHRIVSTDHFLG